MIEFVKNREIYMGEEYKSWSETLSIAHEECILSPSETMHAFWDKYPLLECTILLFQLSIAAKGQTVPLQSGTEKLQEFYDDLSKALIAFYFYSRAEPSPSVNITRKD
ncbi:hypothetical protein [Dyadobacter sp. 3J3]|uniref:hypothetical protein n=1 Tax=Dyadobacter sp. 3J3 TaxID=2606600 RepID=UPI00135BE0F2|nr:hypothetical protein [Dyadobacter sp. 3J3]